MAKRRSSRSASPTTIILAIFVGLVIAIWRLLPSSTITNSVPSTPPIIIANPTTSSQELAWLKVYFTAPDPSGTQDTNSEHYIPRYVVPALDAAKTSVDVLSFDFNLPTITESLVKASRRGIKVRVVVDEENGSTELKASDTDEKQAYNALKVLTDGGIEVVNGGRSSGLMHNKAIIVDSKILFVGSWNISYNDTFRNDNNVLEITDPKLIANYQAKFDEGFVKRQFGRRATVTALNPSITIDGVQVENYFSPDDKVIEKLVRLVSGAKKSVKFMAFTYTHADLSNAMIERSKAGIKVEGVIENRGASQGALPPLFCASVPVKRDGNKNTMHHKVIIIDDSTVVTGSFNFTKAADTENDDNVIIIHSPVVAAQFLKEFDRVYGLGVTPEAADVSCARS
jgi:phosphatidylserine/phosphatidylglycerophosphate/cardiolipin synthase-like enzyme